MTRLTITPEEAAAITALWEDYDSQTGDAIDALGRDDKEAFAKHYKLAGVAIKAIRQIYDDKPKPQGGSGFKIK